MKKAKYAIKSKTKTKKPKKQVSWCFLTLAPPTKSVRVWSGIIKCIFCLWQ